ncbi:MAG: hypothetical protein K0R51_1369 [Cytophagaceae bacterium]|jgi:hypothetical protein|nr:hypothetical protein [Cytophagaceae bacterium]
MNKIVVLIPILFFNCLAIKAQDTTKTENAPAPPAYHVNFSSTAIGNNNTDNSTFVSNNNLKLNVAKDNIYINTMNNWIYGMQTAGLTNNDFFSSVDFNVFAKPSKWYFWGLGTYEKSYSLKINDRFQGGLGVGYQFVYRPNAAFAVSDGILYEETALYDTPKYEVLRNSFRVKHKFVYQNRITIEGAHFWQQALSSWEDYILKSNTTLSVKLKSWLSFTTTFTYNKQNINSKENLLFNLGLSFDKYF